MDEKHYTLKHIDTVLGVSKSLDSCRKRALSLFRKHGTIMVLYKDKPIGMQTGCGWINLNPKGKNK
jgi:hypothetical protein